MPRFNIHTEEYERIKSHIDSVRESDGDAPLQPDTERKVISLINRVEKTIGKRLTDIESEDVDELYISANYSTKTCLWVNSILSKYCRIQCKARQGTFAYVQNWLNMEILEKLIGNMLRDLSGGSGDTATLLIILIMLICCQKLCKVQGITVRHVTQLVREGVTEYNEHIFLNLNHFNNLNLIAIINTHLPSIPNPEYQLIASRSFLKNNIELAGRGIGFSEFYKFSKKQLHKELLKRPQADGLKLLELERTRFHTSIEYATYVLSLLKG